MENYIEARISTAPKICFFCKENQSKYSCPRCNEQYCSLDCYRSQEHAECSESFYRECVTQDMIGLHFEDESKKRMTEILTHLHNDEHGMTEDQSFNDEKSDLDSDDENYVDLHERLESINLDDPEAVWNALTEDEKNEFEALVSAGDITKFVPPWNPWWSYSEETKLVTELKINENLEEALKLCPEVLNAPELTSISRIKPADCVKYNIINALASYAFLMRYFNGEANSFEFAAYFLSICHGFGKNSNFDDEQTAVASVEQECINIPIIETDKTSLEMMRHDLYLFLRGPCKDNQLHYCKCALSDLHRIFTEAKTILRSKSVKNIETNFTKKFPHHGEEHLPKMDLNKMKNNIRKIEYYLSYLRSFGLPLVLCQKGISQ